MLHRPQRPLPGQFLKAPMEAEKRFIDTTKEVAEGDLFALHNVPTDGLVTCLSQRGILHCSLVYLRDEQIGLV